MRKTLSLGVVIAALGLFPAAAQAHHLEQNTSTAACVLVNNQPVIQVRAHYVQFVPADQPIHYVVRVDSVDAQTGDVALNPLPDFFHAVDLPSTPGAHTVLYSSTWNGGANGGYFTTTPPLTCPAPVVPPTVICNGVQVPAGTVCPPPPPVVICNGVTMPTTTPPATCAKKTPPPKKVRKYHCPVIHLIKPNANIQSGRHGVHDFGGRCSKGKIISTTLAITPVSPGRAVSQRGVVHLHARGGIIHGVWLYDLSVWRHKEAWGRYRLKYTFKVRYHGHTFICVRKGTFFNFDTAGLPS
jgi:hypothetical protein